MARIRQIHPAIWTSEQVNNLPVGARLLFVGLISNADDEGRIKASPKHLKLLIFPADSLSPDDVLGWRSEIVSQGLAVLYTNGHEPTEYLYLPNWHRYQMINRRYPSLIPPPPDAPTRVAISLTNRERQAIYERDEYTCQYCGQVYEPGSRSLAIDHVIPLALGGSQEWTNLVTCCKRCNNRKWQKTPEQAGMSLIKLPEPIPSTIVNPGLTGGKLPLTHNNPESESESEVGTESDIETDIESDDRATADPTYPQRDPTYPQPVHKRPLKEGEETFEIWLIRIYERYFGAYRPSLKEERKAKETIRGLGRFDDDRVLECLQQVRLITPLPKYPLAYALKILEERARSP